ncbi:MAG TPA: MarR family transcriptional regulator [Candidatus Kapabacteria bacterium]|nr:MarR family transcriptional regulator [Candidatus Kapabacteria bacterium]
MPTAPRIISPETRNILNAIRRLVQTIRIASRDSEKNVGLSAAQLFVLRKLNEEGDLSLNDLADATLTHQSSVSVVVTKLVERGLIKRTRSNIDGRQLVLNVTVKGQALLRKAPKPAQDGLIVGIEMLDSKSRKDLDRSLARLVDILHLPIDKPAPMLFDGSIGNNKKNKRRVKKE